MPARKEAPKRKQLDAYSLRLDPMLRLATELAASKERRTLASFIEWAIERAVRDINITVDDDDEPINALRVSEAVWSSDEVARFLNLAIGYPGLLTHQQQTLWELIWHSTAFSEPRPSRTGLTVYDPARYVKVAAVRENWDTLKRVAEGELPRNRLPLGEELFEGKRKGSGHGKKHR